MSTQTLLSVSFLIAFSAVAAMLYYLLRSVVSLINSVNKTNTTICTELLALKAHERNPHTTIGPAILQHSDRSDKGKSPPAPAVPRRPLTPAAVTETRKAGSVVIKEGVGV